MNANRFEKNDVDTTASGTLQVKYIDNFVHACLGIVLAAERRNTNKLLDEVFHSEKIYKLNEDMVRNC